MVDVVEGFPDNCRHRASEQVKSPLLVGLERELRIRPRANRRRKNRGVRAAPGFKALDLRSSAFALLPSTPRLRRDETARQDDATFSPKATGTLRNLHLSFFRLE